MISKVVQSNGSVIYLYDLYHTYEIHFHQQAYSILFFFYISVQIHGINISCARDYIHVPIGIACTRRLE